MLGSTAERVLAGVGSDTPTRQRLARLAVSESRSQDAIIGSVRFTIAY